MICYLAYPIDQATQVASWEPVVDQVRKQVLATDVGVFEPGLAFTVTPGVKLGPEIDQVNRAALNQASLLVAILPRQVATVGVVQEIERAASNGIPVAVLTNTVSWSLAGYHPAQVRQFRFDEVDHAVDWVTVEARRVLDARIEAIRQDTVHLRFAESKGSGAILANRLPTRAYDDDAGFDLYVSEQVTIEPGEFVDVPCGVRAELPTGTWGLITGRSSTLRKKKLLVHNGIIDVGWRGELFAGVWNMGDNPVTVEDGDRVAQLILIPTADALFGQIRPAWATSLSEHPRGLNGFGSSGA